MGPIALHGGGEFLPGDEPSVDALLEAARRLDRPETRIVVLPTAAARGRPDRAAATAVAFFEQRAHAAGLAASVRVALVIHAASANDPANARLVESADLVVFLGGDPDLIPDLLRGTLTENALRRVWTHGAAVSGASAGAMALAEWSWTPHGGMPGLGFVAGIAVVPHYDDIRRLAWQSSLGHVAPAGLGYLGLDERTGVISDEDGWQVAGEGAAYWFAAGSSFPIVARHGDRLTLPRRPSPLT